ncbi:MAG: KamA family radical SAM protein [Bacteroidota bacterium]
MFQDNNIHTLRHKYTRLSYHIHYHEGYDKTELLHLFLQENPDIHKMLASSQNADEFASKLQNWINTYLDNRPKAKNYLNHKVSGEASLLSLSWNDIAAIRIADYLAHRGEIFNDPNNNGKEVLNDPFGLLYKDYSGKTTLSTRDFYFDIIALLRQFNGILIQDKPEEGKVKQWMNQHPSGLDEKIALKREKNKMRIIQKIIDNIDKGTFKSAAFYFDEGMSRSQKVERVMQWWNSSKFHLIFAFRNPEIINEMLDNSLDEDILNVMNSAREAGIPFFVNPYYLSLIDIDQEDHSDIPIRDYIFYSEELVEEFGKIQAWEKEDIVRPGEPNAAGWILPMEHNIHRRYPEVSILIPDTVGRACGGLCISCQRMYDFQSGHLNFDLDKLKPKEKWKDKLRRLMQYFEEDSQLRDILITGGDALMSGNKSLEKILDDVYSMAERKRTANEQRPEGKKYAEMKRVRLGTRLPVYIPQRVTDELIEILRSFKEKAEKIGIQQFVIQTHFQSAMEITPEVKTAVQKLLSAGWIVTNQMVFTTASSRRGHASKLRKTLNDIGVLTYYTFSVKGFKENKHNFATNARLVQEKHEEKFIGHIPAEKEEHIKSFPEHAERMIENINQLRQETGIPFLSSDKSVLNMPGVGKSLTFRVIGITDDGRRILQFEHDNTRRHSPIINKMGKVNIIESKTMVELLKQLEKMGEDINEYISVFGYSIGETEKRMSIYEYPEYDYTITNEMTNLLV